MSDPIHANSASKSNKLWALVPCAGTGSRAGGEGPKQYQLIAGLPMVEHTLQALHAVAELHGIVVVTAPSDASQPGTGLPKVRVQACGGASRAVTVGKGLAYLLQIGAAPDDWVLVHDAARCLVLPAQIEALIRACQGDVVGGLLATPLVDTLKEAVVDTGDTPRVACTRSRAGKWLAQTPQMFKLGELMNALALVGDQVTDESSAMEALGLQPLLVACSAQNMKVTYPEDFALAEMVLAARKGHTSNKGFKP